MDVVVTQGRRLSCQCRPREPTQDLAIDVIATSQLSSPYAGIVDVLRRKTDPVLRTRTTLSQVARVRVAVRENLEGDERDIIWSALVALDLLSLRGVFAQNAKGTWCRSRMASQCRV